MMQPLPAARKELWRAGPAAMNAGANSANAISVNSPDAKKGDDVTFIKSRPISNSESTVYSKWSSVNNTGGSSSRPPVVGGTGWATVNKSESYSLEDHPGVRKATGFLGPHIPGITPTDGGSYYGGEYLDPKSTTESLKQLLEGINDEPPSRRTRKKKKELDDLEKALAGTPLKKPSDYDIDEGDEEEEEEEDGTVEGLKVTLLPHQIRGLDFLINRESGKHKGGILADDVCPKSLAHLHFTCALH